MGPFKSLFKNFILFFYFISYHTFAQEGFKFHRVQPGETAYSISRMYEINVEEFFKFNPETRQSLKAGDVVMIPAITKSREASIDTNRFIIHIVREGQTLYSISRQYNVPIDLIEVNNPELSESVIRPGMRLLIPKNPKLAPIRSADISADQAVQAGFHRVKQGETLFSIARSYHITVSDLMNLNPDIDSIIHPGQILRIGPDTSQEFTSQIGQTDKKKSVDSTRFTMHRVEDKETLSMIARKFNLTIDDLYRYNPELRQMSLKTGMLLLIPVLPPKAADPVSLDPAQPPIEEAEVGAIEFVKYFNLQGKRRLHICLILPISPDPSNRELRPSDIVGIDYYLGVKTALEILNKEGYLCTLQVVEFPENSTNYTDLVSKVKNSDIIIGPFVPQQTKYFFEAFSDMGKIPVILPFGNPNGTSAGSIWIQESEDHEMRALASAILNEYPNHPVYLIYSDKNTKANQLNDLLRSYLHDRPIHEVRLTGGLQGLSTVTDNTQQKIVVFFHEEDFLSQQFIDRMRRHKHNILVLSRKILDNPLIEPRYLNQVEFLVTSPRHVQYEHPLVVTASEYIASKYKLETNDIMLYAFQSLYDLVRSLTDSRYTTEFVQIKPTRRKGVFQNNAIKVLTARNYKLVPINTAGSRNK